MITEKQEAVLMFIEEFQMEFGKSPTLREMRERFQVKSDNSILKHLKALKEKGYLEKDDTPRGIKLLNSVKEKLQTASNMIRIPLLGTIPAGGPVISDEHVIDYFEVGSDMLKKPQGSFALTVSGLSMIDAGILEGDFVIANRDIEAKDGDIVVALVDGSNTVKRYRKNGNHVWLEAANPDYNDIQPGEYLEIQGVVTSVIRMY
ncbi:transcriptional repressor LexA [Candidatus Peregrinibacteria bacterium]|jgi:repressor LexA|nr:transcriptional repressor LexA [Candidatus Peregrinibacteria bacterium]MBT4631525.1 transcriptional repressor LexA [Candidatus Peregrinibacteria bacterium]MBT5516980.1 transcriptional repressor LexA [Candidatus Peregrinibacteria bacterium]MBT5824263.1 transcriptional repressor LexA [Candidatus Peregrinibacteria bacterium]